MRRVFRWITVGSFSLDGPEKDIGSGRFEKYKERTGGRVRKKPRGRKHVSSVSGAAPGILCVILFCAVRMVFVENMSPNDVVASRYVAEESQAYMEG